MTAGWQRRGAYGLFVLVAVVYFWPLLRCQGACTIDLARWTGEWSPLVELSQADVRLNTWILAWVQHALLADPAHLFDGNVFHPAPRALAGSEHMLVPAVLGAPVRALLGDATAVYHTTVVLSFALAGATTYALAAWVTRSHGIATFAGLMAMFMPWRLTELSHLQLLFAGWLPLVWLWIGKCLIEGATPARLAALAASWTALIFSSYYLAYFGCFSSAALIAGLLVSGRANTRDLVRTCAALALPLLALALVSIPYLEAREQSDLVQQKNLVLSIPPGAIIEALAPVRWLLPNAQLPWIGGYSLPAFGLALAACALLPRSRTEEASRAHASVARAMTVALLLTCVVTVILSLGHHLHVAGVDVPLPARWAARGVPGFEMLRAPARWLLVPAVALPVLAAIGLWRLEALAGRAVVTALGLVALLPLIPPLPPTMAAYPHEGATLAGYRALASLPAGPVLEIPWPRRPQANANLSSMYMVASTHHWRPLLNGYTAYEPRSYDFLVRAGARLPERSAVERMSALTGLRWLVVHIDRLDEPERTAWLEAQARAPLVPAYQDAQTIIYELADWQGGGTLRERLYTERRFPRTISGLPREPLELRTADSTMSVPFPVTLNRYADGWANQNVPLRITNNTDRPWPGIDPDAEGLVHVRYRVLDGSGAEVLSAVVALDDDVPARGSLLNEVLVQGRLEEASYRLRLELVERAGEEWRTLGVAPVEGDARVVPARGR